MHNVGFPSTLCLALVIVPLLASVATSYPAPEFEELENPVAELPDKRGWTNFHNGGYGKRGWNSFAGGGYGKRAFDYVSISIYQVCNGHTLTRQDLVLVRIKITTAVNNQSNKIQKCDHGIALKGCVTIKYLYNYIILLLGACDTST